MEINVLQLIFQETPERPINTVCPKCFMEMPLTNECDNCDN